MKNSLLILISTCIIFSCESSKKHAFVADQKDSLTMKINHLFERGYVKGFSVAMVNADRILYKQGFGYANTETKEKYTTNTIQNIASISKTILGISLLKAQELEKLNLDDPVNMYLPFKVINPFYPDEVITLRHLATHTSTIKDTEHYGGISYVLKSMPESTNAIAETYVSLNQPDKNIPMSGYLRKVLTIEGEWYLEKGFLNNKPGDLFEYSNVATTLAALALENATGTPYKEFTYDYILKPLGMNATGWTFDRVDFSQHTILYQSDGGEIPFYSLITYPDGGLITSVNDLSKYLLELIRGFSGKGTLLKTESYNELFKKQLAPENFRHQDGENEGIFMSFPSNGLIGHSGGDPGVSTYMFFNPETLTGKIFLCNTDLDSSGQKEFKDILNLMDTFEDRIH